MHFPRIHYQIHRLMKQETKEQYASPEAKILEMSPESAILQMSGGPYPGWGEAPISG